MNHLSIFSGIGGLDLAAEQAGITTVGQCEWADYPTKVLEKHWPDVPRWRDIHTLTLEDFYERTGLRTVDIISGGFPCQPFSVAGNQKGKEDSRYLWPQMLRVIRELKPRWVVGENVPGILRIAAADVIADLEREGYHVVLFDFEAAAVGALHRRERIAFVGHRAGDVENACSGRFCESGDVPKQPRRTESERTGETVAHADNERLQIPGLEPRIKEISEGLRTEHTGCALSYTNDRRGVVRRDGQLSAVTKTTGCWGNHGGRAEADVSGEWWATEPDVGRSLDGVPGVLDGIGWLSDEAKRRGSQTLRDVWGPHVEEALQWAFGRFHGISKQEILLAFLCEYENLCVGGRIKMESTAVAKTIMRNLWRTIESARASYRRQYNTQLSREYSNALLRLSHGAPSLMPQAWANGDWEDGVGRVATGVKDRTDRLKCLGNAVVPQQFYPIFKAIAEEELRLTKEAPHA